MVEGFIFDSGFVSPRFVNDERRNAVNYDNPIFFITDHKLEHVEPVFLSLRLQRGKQPLVIIADEIEVSFSFTYHELCSRFNESCCCKSTTLW